MPVTDGSAGFGLPPKLSFGGDTVPQPRVVVSVAADGCQAGAEYGDEESSANGTEVAAVSEQPGKVEATRRPTSQPVIQEQG